MYAFDQREDRDEGMEGGDPRACTINTIPADTRDRRDGGYRWDTLCCVGKREGDGWMLLFVT